MIRPLVQAGENERGMMKDKKPGRLNHIQWHLRKAPGLRLDQALSLRRHHMKLLNPYKSMPALRLGNDDDIRESAEIFETVVEVFLKVKKIDCLNEYEQKSKFPDYRLTPDFLLTTPITLKKYRSTKDQVVEKRKIHWIEAKMFYGASTIPTGTNGAVGRVLPKVNEYVQKFGEGAIVFMYGCGDRLANELSALGVTALDASAIHGKLMEQVHEHQRTWCAKDGIILP